MDLEGDLLQTADAGRVLIDDLDAPAAAVGVACVHAEEIRGEEAGLVAAGPGANLDDDRLLVVGVFRKQGDLDVVSQALDPSFERGLLLAGECGQLLVRLGACQRLRLAQFPRGALVAAVEFDHALQRGPFLGKRLGPLVVGGDLGVAHALSQRLVALVEPAKPFAEMIDHDLAPGALFGKEDVGGVSIIASASVPHGPAPLRRMTFDVHRQRP